MKKLIMLAVVALMAAMTLTSCADDDNGVADIVVNGRLAGLAASERLK